MDLYVLMGWKCTTEKGSVRRNDDAVSNGVNFDATYEISSFFFSPVNFMALKLDNGRPKSLIE